MHGIPTKEVFEVEYVAALSGMRFTEISDFDTYEEAHGAGLNLINGGAAVRFHVHKWTASRVKAGTDSQALAHPVEG